MNLPDAFPAGTEFLVVDNVPVTRHPGQPGCLAWDEPDALGPRWFPTDVAVRRGTAVDADKFEEMYLRNVNRASPSRLLEAALDLDGRREAYVASLRARGLTPAEMAEVFARNRAENMVVEVERLAIRAIGAAMRSETML